MKKTLTKERPHPMLHGHHDGKMPKEMKGMKEKEGKHMGMSTDHHHSEMMKHAKHLHHMAKKGHKNG